MSKNLNKKKKVLIYLLIFLSVNTVMIFSTNRMIWNFNLSKYIDKKYNKPMSVKSDNEFSYKGKVYRIKFSASKDKKEELYLLCFEKKFNGLFYEPTYGSSPGGSKSLYGMTNLFMNDGTNDSFIVVYGYNKELKANNFSIRKKSDNRWITQDISKKEYFLYTYTSIVYPEIVFKDVNNNDITAMFNGQ